MPKENNRIILELKGFEAKDAKNKSDKGRKRVTAVQNKWDWDKGG